MKTDNKKQMIAIVALAAIMVVVVVFQVLRSSPKTGAAPPDETSVTAADTQQQVAMAVPMEPSGPETGQVTRFVGNPPRDPFEPQLMGASSAASGGIIVPPANNSGKLPRGGMQGPLPPAPLPGFGPLKIEGPGGQAAAGQQEKPPYIATGMVRGHYDVAILHSEDGGRYFAKEGQSVGNGYVVKSISPSGVVLKSKDRRIVLKLGGEQDARSNDRPR